MIWSGTAADFVTRGWVPAGNGHKPGAGELLADLKRETAGLLATPDGY